MTDSQPKGPLVPLHTPPTPRRHALWNATRVSVPIHSWENLSPPPSLMYCIQNHFRGESDRTGPRPSSTTVVRGWGNGVAVRHGHELARVAATSLVFGGPTHLRFPHRCGFWTRIWAVAKIHKHHVLVSC